MTVSEKILNEIRLKRITEIEKINQEIEKIKQGQAYLIPGTMEYIRIGVLRNNRERIEKKLA